MITRTKSFVAQLSPETRMFVNEYGVLLDKYGRFSAFQQLLRDLLAGGARLDAIGLQGHITEQVAGTGTSYKVGQQYYHQDLADVNSMKLHLDLLWEEFNLPIWITEFTFNVAGEIEDPQHAVHAQQLVQQTTLL